MNGILMVIFAMLAAGCGSGLDENFEDYMASMEEVHALDTEYENKMAELDIDSLPEEVSPRNPDINLEKLTTISEALDQEIMPVITQMNDKVGNIEVVDDQLVDLHDTYKESLEVKQDFVQGLNDYVETYAFSVRSNEELIQLSQDFMDNQRERDEVIDAASSGMETEEIDSIISQINENSTELEEESEILQLDESQATKMAHIDNTLLPLIDSHIETLNQMNLDTDSAVRVRSLTLEMYYGFRKYYQERKNTMQYNNRLQELQLQNILPLRETYEELDQEYNVQIEEIESEL
ncbi:EMYY motif lipoprotein [Salinicoccus hispanicus]|uniref:EMYY motif lipoprotein n=1 Tax=Salinicoccus hispanicus TaxID=157225 RepID=A0A6N8TZ24_9STAP|nr:EMYY motif lipoprotein [Salinicoccus hispanicus]MXQ50722.1 EMYY motif lipoprotein [Salinicoccus hispanicus]